MNEAPPLPEGHRFLQTGEQVRLSDLFYSLHKRRWQLTEAAGARIDTDAMLFRYARKEEVPVAASFEL